MFQPSKVLKISNYIFDGEHKPRDKYLIVLHLLDSNINTLLLSFTTTKQHLPDDLLKLGCIKHFENNIHSFYFPLNTVISDCGYCFPEKTFIDIKRQQVFEKKVEDLNVRYVETGMLEEVCTLSQKMYLELLYCISKGRFLPRKTILQIESIIEELISK